MAKKQRRGGRKPKPKTNNSAAGPSSSSTPQPAAASRPSSSPRRIYHASPPPPPQPSAEQAPQPRIETLSLGVLPLDATEVERYLFADIFGIDISPHAIARLAIIPCLGLPNPPPFPRTPLPPRPSPGHIRIMSARHIHEDIEDLCANLADFCATADTLEEYVPIEVDTTESEIDLIQFVRWKQAQATGHNDDDSSAVPPPAADMHEAQRLDNIRTAVRRYIAAKWAEAKEQYAATAAANTTTTTASDAAAQAGESPLLFSNTTTNNLAAASVELTTAVYASHPITSTSTSTSTGTGTSTIPALTTPTANTTTTSLATWRAHDDYLSTLYTPLPPTSPADFDAIMRNMSLSLSRAKLLNEAADLFLEAVKERDVEVEKAIEYARAVNAGDYSGVVEEEDKDGDDDEDSGYGQA